MIASRFASDAYEASVSADAAAGTHVIRVTAVDADRGLNGEVRYRLSKRTLATQSGRWVNTFSHLICRARMRGL